VSRWRREPLRLGLDCRTLAGAVGESATPDESAAWDAKLLADAIRSQMVPSVRYASVHASVAADLCRHFLQAAPAGLCSVRELSQLAAVRASQLFGGTPDEWTVTADWRLSSPSVCAALPTRLTEALRAAAAALHLPLRVESAVLMALERVMSVAASNSGLAWRTPTGTVLAQVNDRGTTHLRWSRTGADLPGAQWVQQAGRELVQDSLRGTTAPQTLWLASPLEVHIDDVPVGMGSRALQAKAVPTALMLPAVTRLRSEAAWAYHVACGANGRGRAL
jgi:hypothetical protein